MKHNITSLLPSTKKRGAKLTLDERIEKAMKDIKRESKKTKRKKGKAGKTPTKPNKPVEASRDLPLVIIKKKRVSVDKD